MTIMALFLRMQNGFKLLNEGHGPNGPCLLFRSLIADCSPRWYSSYRRPGMASDNTPPWKKINFNLERGIEIVKIHLGRLKNEMIDHLKGYEGQSLSDYLLQQTKVAWQFRSEEDVKQWVISSDAEIGGKTDVYLKLGKNNQSAVLYGTISTTVPRDGTTKYSGYCAMRVKPRLGAFNRNLPYDWTNFNCLHLRVRGDGRPWMITVYTNPYFHHKKDELYFYFIYTRGGPYWEEIKVPFSKFVFSSRGRIQDNQGPLYLDKISTFGFTLGDDVGGPFQLEIDYIGLIKDRGHHEEFAYEVYKKIPI